MAFQLEEEKNGTRTRSYVSGCMAKLLVLYEDSHSGCGFCGWPVLRLGCKACSPVEKVKGKDDPLLRLPAGRRPRAGQPAQFSGMEPLTFPTLQMGPVSTP